MAASAASAGCVCAAGAAHAAAALSSVQRGSAARSGPGALRPCREPLHRADAGRPSADLRLGF